MRVNPVQKGLQDEVDVGLEKDALVEEAVRIVLSARTFEEAKAHLCDMPALSPAQITLLYERMKDPHPVMPKEHLYFYLRYDLIQRSFDEGYNGFTIFVPQDMNYICQHSQGTAENPLRARLIGRSLLSFAGFCGRNLDISIEAEDAYRPLEYARDCTAHLRTRLVELGDMNGGCTFNFYEVETLDLTTYASGNTFNFHARLPKIVKRGDGSIGAQYSLFTVQSPADAATLESIVGYKRWDNRVKVVENRPGDAG